MEKPQDSINELITKDELARRLKVTTRTINEWMNHLRLPHIKAGRAVRFNWTSVVNHLERHYGKGVAR